MNESPSFATLCDALGYVPKGRPLRSHEAAALTGLAVSTLLDMRIDGTGPAFFKPTGSKLVFYSERDLLTWMYGRGPRTSTSRSAAELARA